MGGITRIVDDVDGIAHALGGRKSGGGWICKCPSHDDRSPSLSISQGDCGKVLLHCFSGCGQEDVLDALRARGLWPDQGDPQRRPAPAVRARERLQSSDARRTAAALRVWHETILAPGTPVETYLGGRGCGAELPHLGHVIRFHHSCQFGSGADAKRHPAMIALYRDIRTDEPKAVHRTALAGDGRAIVGGDGKKLKTMLGPVGQAAIKLSPNEDVCQGIGVAEGLETSLSVIAGFRPVWCLGSAGSVRAFPVLGGIGCLTIFADHDTAGLEAAQVCGQRWQAAGREVFIRWPKGLGRDYADEAAV